MKRGKKTLLTITIIILLLTITIINAQEIPGGVEKEEVEKIKDTVDKLPIEDGKINTTAYRPYVSKADIRIQKINNWLDENVSWLKYIFHMKPQISWLFAFNIYIILLFFLVLFLNGPYMFFFIKKRARIIGGAIFLIFLVLGLYEGIAIAMENYRLYLTTVLWQSAKVLAIIILIIAIIIMIVAFPIFESLALMIKNYFATKQQIKDKIEMATAAESVEKMMEAINPPEEE